MYIFLIIWFLFLFVYIIFNIYGLYRVCAMRFKGDAVSRMVMIYLVAMFIIIFLSILFISHLDWSKSLKDIFKF
ncbi:MAG: hypothetical protein US31_C0011G0004 [Berkelbacteria bacterium GW2011_GWA1_36_9]|uniref:Uncharacterized protein n=1 Tax=Berkelbacteria bacterium GW2011_GWA1_36_9 TaxID=1618331 RepID=A0A0G0FJK3_9BACT|nr:MAG: hypothetical protein US31_C0011G0004 [Berkelbacteria bacterium GW2011_GWA1_36_9]